MGIECGVTVHFTIDLEVRCARSEQCQRCTHFFCRLAVVAAEIGMREQGSARMQTKAAHFFRSHDGDLGQLLCGRIFIDVGIHQHQLTIGQDQRIHCCIRIDPRALAQYLIDIVQM